MSIGTSALHLHLSGPEACPHANVQLMMPVIWLKYRCKPLALSVFFLRLRDTKRMHCGFYSTFILSATNGRVLWAAAFETEGRCGVSVVIARLPFQQPLLCLEQDGKGFWQLFWLYRLHERPLSLASEGNICHSSSTLRQWVQRRCIDSQHGMPLLAGLMTEEKFA